MAEIDKLVITSPYKEPTEHWRFNEETQTYDRVKGRRPAGYVKATEASQSGDARGTFIEIPLANIIRERVGRWRKLGRPGITGITRELFEHWNDNSKRNDPLFFCQIEAMETMVWLAEAGESEKLGINIPLDGGEFVRKCLKMATGTGKTIVMAMLIVWQTLNKVASPSDDRFAKYFLIMAPGLTVRTRLQVLWPPDSDSSYYRKYGLIPDSMYEKLKEARVAIHNWHVFFPALDEHSVDLRKRIREDDAPFARRILEHNYDNIVVINDEAHHAWRKPQNSTEEKFGADREEMFVATNWVDGLDKIHRSRTIKACYDFTATPYMPSGKKIDAEDLFKWVVLDFSLNDAIESGLVKTPRMPVGDDGEDLSQSDKSAYYHLYDNDKVKPSLRSTFRDTDSLPDLVRNGYMLLAKDWERSKGIQAGQIPPVMITVCNVQKTSARIVNFFKNDPYDFGELADEKDMIRIDTNMLKMESGYRKIQGEYSGIRDKINTTGKIGEAGEQIKNIIAVQMLSEGWDANNVTQIMGLRAFTSQLLCEQVIGRGLRRQSYELNEEGLFNAEYVNVLGVPFSFLPHEGSGPKREERHRIEIRPMPQNLRHEITWPNVSRIETVVASSLKIDMSELETLEISARNIDTRVTIAPMISHIPKLDSATEISLRDAYSKIRMQTIIFHVVGNVCRHLQMPDWNGNPLAMFAQIAEIVKKFISDGRLSVTNMPDESTIRRHLAIMFNMNAIVNHTCKIIQSENAQSKKLIFGSGGNARSTGRVSAWYTTKGVIDNVKKSHMAPSPYDNGWEKEASMEFERNDRVRSWVKNDRLGFSITYQHEGHIHEYYPDFLLRLGSRESGFIMLILEVKGQKSAQSNAKHKSLAEWVGAVNDDGCFGTWKWDVAYKPGEVSRIIKQHNPA